MIIVGLTGGIGSGKSTVGALLVERGALLVDADAIVRELQQPGRPALGEMLAAFGDEILAADGTLDRQAVATRVFDDPAALRTLNDIVHPAVRTEIARRVLDAVDRGAADVVVLDIPLVTDPRRDGMQALIVVDVAVEVALDRLVDHRGMDEADARARIASQISREQRRAIADFVIDNSGTLEDLERQVDDAWTWIGERSAVVDGGVSGPPPDGPASTA